MNPANDPITPELSEYMSKLSKSRKSFKGGFTDPDVQAKIRKIKDEKKRIQKKEEKPQTDSQG